MDLYAELLGTQCLRIRALTQARVKPGLAVIPSTTEQHPEVQAHGTVKGKNSGSYACRDLAALCTGKVEQELTVLWEQNEHHHQKDEYMVLKARNT